MIIIGFKGIINRSPKPVAQLRLVKTHPAGWLSVHLSSPIAKHLLGDHEKESDLGPDPKEPTV